MSTVFTWECSVCGKEMTCSYSHYYKTHENNCPGPSSQSKERQNGTAVNNHNDMCEISGGDVIKDSDENNEYSVRMDNSIPINSSQISPATRLTNKILIFIKSIQNRYKPQKELVNEICGFIIELLKDVRMEIEKSEVIDRLVISSDNKYELMNEINRISPYSGIIESTIQRERNILGVDYENCIEIIEVKGKGGSGILYKLKTEFRLKRRFDDYKVYQKLRNSKKCINQEVVFNLMDGMLFQFNRNWIQYPERVVMESLVGDGKKIRGKKKFLLMVNYENFHPYYSHKSENFDIVGVFDEDILEFVDFQDILKHYVKDYQNFENLSFRVKLNKCQGEIVSNLVSCSGDNELLSFFNASKKKFTRQVHRFCHYGGMASKDFKDIKCVGGCEFYGESLVRFLVKNLKLKSFKVLFPFKSYPVLLDLKYFHFVLGKLSDIFHDFETGVLLRIVNSVLLVLSDEYGRIFIEFVNREWNYYRKVHLMEDMFKEISLKELNRKSVKTGNKRKGLNLKGDDTMKFSVFLVFIVKKFEKTVEDLHPFSKDMKGKIMGLIKSIELKNLLYDFFPFLNGNKFAEAMDDLFESLDDVFYKEHKIREHYVFFYKFICSLNNYSLRKMEGILKIVNSKTPACRNPNLHIIKYAASRCKPFNFDLGIPIVRKQHKTNKLYVLIDEKKIREGYVVYRKVYEVYYVKKIEHSGSRNITFVCCDVNVKKNECFETISLLSKVKKISCKEVIGYGVVEKDIIVLRKRVYFVPPEAIDCSDNYKKFIN